MARPREVPHSVYVWLAAFWPNLSGLDGCLDFPLGYWPALALSDDVEAVWWAIANCAAVV